MSIKPYRLVSLGLFLAAAVFAKSPADTAKELSLNPASKASKQWERLFSNEDKMREAKIDKLSDGDKSALKSYLIQHAADSDHPTVAGK